MKVFSINLIVLGVAVVGLNAAKLPRSNGYQQSNGNGNGGRQLQNGQNNMPMNVSILINVFHFVK